MSTYATRALSGYRRLFRARNKLFAGDIRAMAESRLAIRAEFDKNRTVTEPNHLEGLLVMIDEAEDMLLHGIVQGKLNESGNYEVKVQADHAEAGDNAPTMEPVTQKTVEKMTGAPPQVEVTKSKTK